MLVCEDQAPPCMPETSAPPEAMTAQTLNQLMQTVVEVNMVGCRR